MLNKIIKIVSAVILVIALVGAVYAIYGDATLFGIEINTSYQIPG